MFELIEHMRAGVCGAVEHSMGVKGASAWGKHDARELAGELAPGYKKVCSSGNQPWIVNRVQSGVGAGTKPAAGSQNASSSSSSKDGGESVFQRGAGFLKSWSGSATSVMALPNRPGYENAGVFMAEANGICSCCCWSWVWSVFLLFAFVAVVAFLVFLLLSGDGGLLQDGVTRKRLK